MHTKGMSSIVATSLIITLTILAAAVLGTFVVPFVQKNLERSSECNNYENYFSFESDLLGAICYQESSKKVYLVVGAANDRELERGVQGFSLLLIQIATPSNPGGRAVSVRVSESGADNAALQLLNTEGQLVPALRPKAGEVLTYVYNDGQKYNRAEIAPIVGNGRVCEKKSDTVKILPCGNARP